MASAADVARRNAFWRQLVSFSKDKVQGTCADLASVGGEPISHKLLAAFVALESKDFEGCNGLADAARLASWDARKVDGEVSYGGQGSSAWPHVCWREAYVFAQLFQACALLSLGTPDYQAAMCHLDTTVILSGMLPPARSMIQFCDPYARSALATTQPSVERQHAGLVWLIPETIPAETVSIKYPLGRVATPELSEFARYVETHEPVVLTGTISQWPAQERWRDLRYLYDNYGHRSVPVEIGRHGEGMWCEEVMSLSRLLADYMAPCNTQDVMTSRDVPLERIAYLAQHSLFEHLPTLRHDIAVPAYAKAFLSAGEPHINAWIGTAGTVTPLHTDTYDNILAQVAGFKYIRLYKADQTPFLYVDTGPDARGNMSTVRCEREDHVRHPLAQHATYTETILGPGDTLFIPRGCWHYVRSLTASVSVNFWFV